MTEKATLRVNFSSGNLTLSLGCIADVTMGQHSPSSLRTKVGGNDLWPGQEETEQRREPLETSRAI